MSEPKPGPYRRRLPSVMEKFLHRSETSVFEDSIHGEGVFGGVGGDNSVHGSYSTAQSETTGRTRGSQRDMHPSNASSAPAPSQQMEDFLKRTENVMSINTEMSRSRIKRSGIRYLLLCMVRHKAFAMFIYSSITYNTVTIAMNDFWADRENGSVLKLILDTSDWVVLGIFTVEMFLKMIAMGIGFKSPRESADPNNEEEAIPLISDDDHEDDGYFVSYWNRMDCAIVILSWILIAIRESGLVYSCVYMSVHACMYACVCVHVCVYVCM
jgi:hypothetical protein